MFGEMPAGKEKGRAKDKKERWRKKEKMRHINFIQVIIQLVILFSGYSLYSKSIYSLTPEFTNFISSPNQIVLPENLIGQFIYPSHDYYCLTINRNNKFVYIYEGGDVCDKEFGHIFKTNNRYILKRLNATNELNYNNTHNLSIIDIGTNNFKLTRGLSSTNGYIFFKKPKY